MNDRGSNGTDSWRIEVRPDTAKLTNVIVTGFGERFNLVREGKMFVKEKAKISSRVGGVKWRFVCFATAFTWSANRRYLVHRQQLRVPQFQWSSLKRRLKHSNRKVLSLSASVGIARTSPRLSAYQVSPVSRPGKCGETLGTHPAHRLLQRRKNQSNGCDNACHSADIKLHNIRQSNGAVNPRR